MTANTAVSPIGSANPATGWGVATRVAFRFFFCYFSLYCFPFPFASVEDGGDPLPALWHRAVPWVYLHILHHPIVLPPEIGGTDTSYDYALCLLLLMIAGVATLIWSILDRRRANYETLHLWTRLYVAVYLGVQMLSFGVAKVLPSQFPPPTLSRLSMRVGDLSTHQLLWIWMSSTRLYQAFAGWVETIGGALLFIPRLSTLGALVTAGAMTNVFVLNLSYNVDEKLFSFHLLAMAVFVAAPDFRKVADVLVFRRSVDAIPLRPFFERKWLNHGLFGITAIYSVAVAAYFVVPELARAR